MNSIKSNFTIIILLLFTQAIHGQQNTLPITLEKVLELAGAGNLTIQEYKQRQELAKADLTTAKQWWLPELYAGVSTHKLWGAAMNADGRFFLDVNRENLWAGLGVNAVWDFNKGVYQVSSVKLRLQATKYKTKSEKNQALLTIIETYYDFLTAQLYYQAYSELAQQADTIAQQLTIQVEAGLRFQSEALLARSNYNHLRVEMLNAKGKYGIESAKLINLLNLDPGVNLVSIDSLLMPLELIKDVSEEKSWEEIYQLRPELKAEDFMLQSLRREKKSVTTGLLMPSLRIGAYGSYFGDVVSPLYPTSELNASLLWRIPIGRLTSAGEVKQFNAQIALQETRINQVKNQVNEEVLSSKRLLDASRLQMEIAKEGSELAKEALEQSIQRQLLGTVKPFEVLQAQEIYIKSKLDYLRAVSTYNTAQYKLHVATGNNL